MHLLYVTGLVRHAEIHLVMVEMSPTAEVFKDFQPASSGNGTTHAQITHTQEIPGQSTSGSGGLTIIAKHFLVVGVLFVVVLILAVVNLWISYRHRERERWRLHCGDKRVIYRIPTVSRADNPSLQITVKMRPKTTIFI